MVIIIRNGHTFKSRIRMFKYFVLLFLEFF